MLAGQAMVGGSISLTMTLKVQLAVLPEPSVAVCVTVLVPLAKVEPLGRLQLTVTFVQLSLASTVHVTLDATQVPAVVFVTISAGHVMVGGWMSLKMMVKLQLAVLPEPSVAVQVTVFVPMANVEPLAGAQ